MFRGDPIASLHAALAAAVHRDLPEHEFEHRDWGKWSKMTREEQEDARKNHTEPVEMRKCRPSSGVVDVFMFNQTWGSTALGYGGVGGQAMTEAYTVVIEFMGTFCVYFGSDRLAYKINADELISEGYQKFCSDLANRNMPGVAEASMRYKKK